VSTSPDSGDHDQRRRSRAQSGPYAFTGTVKKVIFDLKPAARHEDDKALHEAAIHGATAHGISA
jgi:arylsulfatase